MAPAEQIRERRVDLNEGANLEVIVVSAQKPYLLLSLLLLAVGTASFAAPITRAQASAVQNSVAPQTTAAPTPLPTPIFDVAAIRLHQPLPHEHSSIYDTNGRFITANVSLKAIVQWAFDIPASRIVGGPAWLDSARFDIKAEAENALDTARTYDSSAAKLEKQRMVQALLADRFKLTTHPETRELPIYALVAAKGGPKFLATQVSGTSITRGRDHIQAEGGDNTLTILAEQLAETLDRVVVDKTGIQGRYSLTLKWTPDDAAPTPDSSESSIFTAMEEQLGLKIVSQKGPVQVLVIDHVEMPTEN